MDVAPHRRAVSKKKPGTDGELRFSLKGTHRKVCLKLVGTQFLTRTLYDLARITPTD